MNLKASFVTFLNQKFPGIGAEVLENTVAENLLSPFQVNLTRKQMASIQTEINAYWKLREWGQTHLAADYEKFGLRIPKNYSACMSYDFHISVDGNLELIEINTNASFLALGLQMYSFLKLKNVASAFDEKALVEMFKSEIALCGHRTNSVSIFDDAPGQQRLYLEFLIYKEIFEKNNVLADIVSLENVQLLKKNSLVYNRYTDFMLQEPRSAQVKNFFNSSEVELSPNPYEYFMLADKKRFLDWNKQTDLPKPTSLLPTYDLGVADRDKVWNERKTLFFKPKNSFGSKQAYRGASISRRTFDEVFNDGFIAQKLSHPGEIEVLFEGQKQIMKYDLRCYAYQEQLQLVVARIYQGQTTNLRTPGGGFAAVTLS
ncbi:MAG: hypothetical protein H7328_08850 [Bdellovibrio sp.]|nr:hypothetical protein [Bdellovibrio sp.]